MGEASGNLVRELSSKENMWLIFLQRKCTPVTPKNINVPAQPSYICFPDLFLLIHLLPRSFLTLAGCLSSLFRIPCTGQERTITLPLDMWNLLSSAKSFQHHQYYGSRFHISGETQALLTSSNVTKGLRVDALGDTWVPSAQVVDQVLKMG